MVPVEAKQDDDFAILHSEWQNLLHSEWPKLYGFLAVLSAEGLKKLASVVESIGFFLNYN